MATKARKKAATKRPVVGRKSATKGPAVRRKVAAPRKKATSARNAKRFAGVGSEAVMKATGRAWDEWLKVLDRAGAKSMPHKEIARLLHQKFSVPGWWSQMVTVGYEQARGLREVHQKGDGFSASASRTVNVALAELFDAWSEAAARAKWLPGASLVVRKSTANKSMRITWSAGGSNVDVGFFAKGPGKSVVQVEHSKLADSRAVAKQKEYWAAALDRLKTFVEP